MVERRRRSGFVHQTCFRGFVAGDVERWELERDVTIEPAVVGLVDDAHAAATEGLDDLVLRNAFPRTHVLVHVLGQPVQQRRQQVCRHLLERIGRVVRLPVLSDFAAEPLPGSGPFALHRARRDREGGGGVIHGHPAKDPTLHNPAATRMQHFHFRQGRIERQQSLRAVVRAAGVGDANVLGMVESNDPEVAAPLPGAPVAGMIAEYVAHRTRSQREEVGAALGSDRLLVHELQIRLVHERGRVERVVSAPALPLLMSQYHELVVYQRQERIQGRAATKLHFAEQSRNCPGGLTGLVGHRGFVRRSEGAERT